MPSESSFKTQIALVQAYIESFNNISKLNAPEATKASIDNLSSATSDLHKFIPHFNERDVYIDTVIAAYEALDAYFSKYTAVARPFSYNRVVGLYSMAKNLTSSQRQGTYFGSPLSLFLFISSIVLLDKANAPLRQNPEKKSKAKTVNVRPSFLLLILEIKFYFIRPRFQGKRMRLSKDTVESEDEAVKFLEDSAASTDKCDDCGASHSLETCPKVKESHREHKNTPVSLFIVQVFLILI